MVTTQRNVTTRNAVHGVATVAHDELPRAISRREAARCLGISLRTLDNWCRRGVLGSVRIEGRVLIPLSEIERILSLPT
jgi:excisionase family DNA binding protein